MSLELPVHLLKEKVVCDLANRQASLVHYSDDSFVWLVWKKEDFLLITKS